MTRRFESKLTAGFASVAIILACVVALAVANSRQIRQANEDAARTQETLRELDRVLGTMLDAETGMRGYILTGEEAYLEPYSRAVATIGRRMDRLQQLLDTSGANVDYTRLQTVISNQIAFRKSVVDQLETTRGSTDARNSLRADLGKRGMDDIRRIVSEMEATQERALAQRRAISEEMDDRSIGMLILCILLTVALLVGGMLLVRHQFAARAKLEQERNRFFTLSDDLYVIAGTEGFFKEVNPATQRTLRFTQEELTGRPFLEFVHPDDRKATEHVATQLAQGERILNFENRYGTKDGDYRWILWSAVPVPKEKLIYAVGKDITEHKKAEMVLAELVEETKLRAAELESVNKELEAFSYSVSHDLRAPLRHIAGFSDMLQRHADGSLDDKGKRYLKTIVDSAKRMGALIDDLLVFSRMGRSEMRRERVDLNALVDQTIEELAPDVGSRKVQWKKETLPTVFGDRAMLKQVVMNLISNALKYSAVRDVTEIEIGSREEPEEYVFFVRDNGVGFDMAYAHKLFGVFQRLHEASQFEGTGIGLANVRRIVTRHGGRTWAEAELDKGATFYFSLPKAKVNAAA